MTSDGGFSPQKLLGKFFQDPFEKNTAANNKTEGRKRTQTMPHIVGG